MSEQSNNPLFVVAAVTSSLACSVLAVLSADDYWSNKGWLSEKQSLVYPITSVSCISATGLMNFTYYLWVHKELYEKLVIIARRFHGGTLSFLDLSSMLWSGVAHGLSTFALSYLAISQAPKNLQLPLWMAAIFSIFSESVSRFNAIAELLENKKIIFPFSKLHMNTITRRYRDLAIASSRYWYYLAKEKRIELEGLALGGGDLDTIEATFNAALIALKQPEGHHLMIKNILHSITQTALYILFAGVAVLFNYLMFEALLVIEAFFQLEGVPIVLNFILAALLEMPSVIMYFLFFNDFLFALGSLNLLLQEVTHSSSLGAALFAFSLLVFAASFSALAFAAGQMLESPAYSILSQNGYSQLFFMISGGLASSSASAYATSKLITQVLDDRGLLATTKIKDLVKAALQQMHNGTLHNKESRTSNRIPQATEAKNLPSICKTCFCLFGERESRENEAHVPLLRGEV